MAQDTTFRSPYVADAAAYRADRYYRYAELTALLHAWAEAHPQWAALSSIGKSYEGREIWCMTLTNSATGSHDTKPGYYIDANLHAGEVTGSAVALYTIHQLLTDPEATRLLDDFAFYVVPRVAVDGAEIYLSEPASMRSSVRPYPEAEEAPGLRKADLDGDGWITSMRFKHPHGAWKVSQKDPRLMIPRLPDETGGEYYWVVPEGLIDPAPDGLIGEIKVAKPLQGLDLNRNFPAAWEGEHLQAGAGPYPLSEPETRAVAEFMLSRPNLAGSQHYHTFSAVILRPSSRRPDHEFPLNDLARYRTLGAIGTEETGYPCISIYHDFGNEDRRLHPGMHLDWSYDHLGLLSFSTELWSLAKAAGIEVKDPLEFYFRQGRSEEDDLNMLRWVDQHLGHFGFAPWKPFDHPQLGPVEIGGWRLKFVFQNAPGPFLEEICRQNARFTLRAAACSPRLRLTETQATALGDRLYRLEAVVENTGFLPTQVTEQAVALKVVKPDRVTLSFGPGVTLVSGAAEQELGFIPGRDGQYKPLEIFLSQGVPNRRKATWVVQAEPGCELRLEARSQRGGCDSRTVVI